MKTLSGFLAFVFLVLAVVALYDLMDGYNEIQEMEKLTAMLKQEGLGGEYLVSQKESINELKRGLWINVGVSFSLFVFFISHWLWVEDVENTLDALEKKTIEEKKESNEQEISNSK